MLKDFLIVVFECESDFQAITSRFWNIWREHLKKINFFSATLPLTRTVLGNKFCYPNWAVLFLALPYCTPSTLYTMYNMYNVNYSPLDYSTSHRTLQVSHLKLQFETFPITLLNNKMFLRSNRRWNPIQRTLDFTM